MNPSRVFGKAWQMLWQYRALWLFGAILALVGANALFLGPWSALRNEGQWTKIKVAEGATIQVPGVDATIDLTVPGVRIIAPDGTSWQEFRDLVEELDRDAGISLWPIVVEFAVILVVALLLRIVARYVVETAVIRMVDEAEDTGRRLSVRKGLRRGLSLRALRLFLLDLGVGALALLGTILVFGLALAPILLAIGSDDAILITIGVGTVGLLALAVSLWFAASAVLSLVLQPIRRACVLEDQSLWASIRQGVGMAKCHLKEVGLIWLVWMGIRLLRVPLGLLTLILLTPVLLLTVLAGAILGGVPAALVAGISALFVGGATPWIMGGLAGLPVFAVVTISPLLFVSGLVQIYLSCIWTLAYRDLRATETPVPAPRTSVAPASTLA